MTWTVETMNDAVDRVLRALSYGMVAPHVLHLTGPLREMRLSGRDGAAQALYVAARGRRVRSCGCS